MLDTDVVNLLKQWLGIYQIKPYRSGANNSGYIVTTQEQQYFLKCYLKQAGSIVRIEREIKFIQFCQSTQYQTIARVVESSLVECCVLFEFIANSSNKLEQSMFVDQAFGFVKHINKASCTELKNASDAAFTVADFHCLVARRFSQLKALDIPKVIASEIDELVNNIEHYYNKVKLNSCRYSELSCYTLASPSDFGAHNALLNNGCVYFIDFEYAGKDSLWKLFADFFAQPQYPINSKAIIKLNEFISVEMISKNSSTFCYVYQLTLIKWSLLMLQTGLRLNRNRNNELAKHVAQVFEYFNDIENKLELMNKNILSIRS